MEKCDIKQVINELKSVLPQKWQMVNMYIEISENSWEIFYYCIIDGISKPVQCYNVDTIEEEKIDMAFNNIQGYVRPFLQNRTTNIITLTLFNDNLYRIKIDCPNLPDGSYDYKKEWIIRNATFLNLDEVIYNYHSYKQSQIIVFDKETGIFSNYQYSEQQLEELLKKESKIIVLSSNEKLNDNYSKMHLLKKLYTPLSNI